MILEEDRHSTRSGPRTLRRVRQSLLAGLLPVVCAQSAAAAGFPMTSSLGISDKPQSKVWSHAGSWWAAINGVDHLGIYELSGGTWSERDSVGPAVAPTLQGGTNDVLWDGTHLYVAAFDSVAAPMYRFTWVDSTRHYARDPGFPVHIPMGPGSETIVIAKDSSGRLWEAHETGLDILVRYTTTNDTTWAGPLVLAGMSLGGPVSPDDIVALVTFGNSVGILWSNQQDYAFYFRTHSNQDAPDVWSPPETVIQSVNVADDHIHLTCDAGGRVYAALKDQSNHLIVARRNLDGTWSANCDVSYGQPGTRPIVVVDDSLARIYCFYTRWPSGGHAGDNWIEYRVASTSNLLFGLENVFISAPNVSMNNVQSTKQRLPSGALLVLCDANDGQVYWNGWGSVSNLGGTGASIQLPGAPTSPTPPASSLATFPGSGTSLAAFPFDSSGGSTASDASGHTHVAVLGSEIAADNAEPAWVSGLTGNALRLDGINDYLTIADPGDLSIRGSFTVELWMKPLGQPDGKALVSKGSTATRNYRLMTTRYGGVEFSWKDTAGILHGALADAVLLDNAWHHVAGVWDEAAQECRIYVDGELHAASPASGTPSTSSEPVYVGARQTSAGVNAFLYATIDQLRISAGAVYHANFTPALAFRNAPTRYVKLTWSAPPAQGGIQGYNVYRALNGAGVSRLNGSVLVGPTEFNDAGASDGLLTYQISVIDLLGQESLPSQATPVEFESVVPASPHAPRDFALSRHTRAADLALAFLLDEGQGQEAHDATGHGHSGWLGRTAAAETLDATWCTGVTRGGLEFDGLRTCVTVPDAPDLRLAGSMTLETWFQLTQLGLQGTLLSKGGSLQRNYRITVLTTGKLQFSWDSTTNQTHTLLSSRAVTDLGWHHVACIYDAEAGTTRMYLDGTAAGAQADAGTPRTGGDPLLLGARYSNGNVLRDWFKGRLDLVQIAAGVQHRHDFVPEHEPARSAGGYVSLRWTLPDLGLVRGYNVYRQVSGEQPSVRKLNAAGLCTDLFFTDDEPHPGTDCYWVQAVNAQGAEGSPTATSCAAFVQADVPSEAQERSASPGVLRISPNPLHAGARLSFRIESGSTSARFNLFDVAGRRVRSWNLGDLGAGQHTLALTDPAGARLGAGVYFLRCNLGGRVSSSRLVVIE